MTCTTAFASATAGFICAVNAAFCFCIIVLAVACVADVVVTLQYQAALPPTVGAAFGCSLLLCVALPWLLAILAACVDYSMWPIKFGQTKKTVLALLPKCGGAQQSSSSSNNNNNNSNEDEETVWHHVRHMIWYLLPLLIWVISTSVGMKADSTAGTALFLLLSFIFIIVNGIFDFHNFRLRPVEESSFLFVLFRRGWFPVVAICCTLITLTSIAAQEISMIRGGGGAVAVVYIVLLLFIVVHIFIHRIWGGREKSDSGENDDDAESGAIISAAAVTHKTSFVARGRAELALAGGELLAVVVSGICIATSFDANDSVGVWIFFGVLLLTYGQLVWSDVVVDLDADGAAKTTKRGDPAVVALVEQEEGNRYQGVQDAEGSGANTRSMFTYTAGSAAAATAAAAADPTTNSSAAGSSSDHEVADTTAQLRSQDSISPAPDSKSNNNNNNNGGGSFADSSIVHHSNISSIGDGASASAGNYGAADQKSMPLVSRCSDMLFEDGNNQQQQTGLASRRSVAGGGGGGASSDNTHSEQRTLARRIALVIMSLAVSVVMISSLINTLGDNRAVSCPKKFPGANHSWERYSVCDLQFAGGATITDFTSLCAASYFTDANFRAALDIWWPGQNVSIIGSSSDESSKQQKMSAVHYFSVYFPKKNLTVVLVRGSAVSLDWIADTMTSSEAVSISLGTALLPVFFGLKMKAVLVDVISKIKLGSMSYYAPIHDEVNRVKRVYPQTTTLLTAHSLGGHVVNVVGAQTNTRTVAVSPFGTGMQYQRLNFAVGTANEVITSLIPKGDLVPKVDVQLGNQQLFDQLEKCGSANAMCHSIAATQRAIARNCGDPLGRFVVKASATGDQCKN